MSLEQRIEIQKNVDAIQAMVLAQAIPVRTGVGMINSVINGVTRVEVKEGLKYKIINHNEVYELNFRGIKRRDEELLNALAIGLYTQVKRNGHYNAGAIHLGKDCSTKHHTEGIAAYTRKYGL